MGQLVEFSILLEDLMHLLVAKDEACAGKRFTPRLIASRCIADAIGSATDADCADATLAHGVALVDRRLPDGDRAEVTGTLRQRVPGPRVNVILGPDSH
jgi:DNA-binding LytR/AlgR family response regulator